MADDFILPPGCQYLNNTGKFVQIPGKVVEFEHIISGGSMGNVRKDWKFQIGP